MPKDTPQRQSFLSRLGPGLITGAADDDPSGIGTHSQIGAQFGYGLSWTFLFSFPLMVAIQEVAAQIGRVTGAGIARNLRRPRWDFAAGGLAGHEPLSAGTRSRLGISRDYCRFAGRHQ